MMPNTRAFVAAIIAIICSGVLYALSTGFYHLWFLAWLAPLPVLLYALSYPFWPTVCVAFLASFLGKLNFLTYLSTALTALS